LERLGTTGVTIREVILTEAGEVVAQARVVTVRWDGAAYRPVPFSEAKRVRLTG
jgi:acyl-CoA thioesterase FadM